MEARNLRKVAFVVTSCVFVYFLGGIIITQILSEKSVSEIPSTCVKLESKVVALGKAMLRLAERTEQISCKTSGIGTRGGFCLTPAHLGVGGNWAWDLDVAIHLESTLFDGQRVLDMGAGLGWYGRYWLRKSNYLFPKESRQVETDAYFNNSEVMEALKSPQRIASWKGYDGAGNVREVTGGLVQFMDLSEDVDLSERYSWVISLEVAEHIPEIYEKTFLDNLALHACNGIVMSWAVPGQGGHHHVNNKPNSYVKEQMRLRGFVPDVGEETKLRDLATLSWLKGTILVFRRNTGSRRDPGCVSALSS